MNLKESIQTIANNNLSGKEVSPVPSRAHEVWSFIKTLAILFVIAIILRGTVVEAFKIPSASMMPTLQIGDHILVSKFSYGLRLPFINKTLWSWDSPKHGDVVVFTRPDDPLTSEDESCVNIIKRVVGLPGDVVEIRRTRLYVNHALRDETWARYEEGGIREEGNFGPEIVPEGSVFMLGDNRDHSKDSRFWSDPFLPIARIKGRALIIYWSWYGMNRIGKVVR